MKASAPSLMDVLAQTYAGLSASRLQAQIAVSVLKKVQDAQKTQAEALVRMIEQSAPARTNPSNSRIDILA